VSDSSEEFLLSNNSGLQYFIASDQSMALAGIIKLSAALLAIPTKCHLSKGHLLV
jgi:hypothetical protein